MAAFDLVSFDGNTIGPGTNYLFFLDADDPYVRSGTIETVARRNLFPTVDSTAQEPRTLLIHGTAASGLAAATFRSNVQNWFDPNQNADGPRYLVMVGDDGSTNIRLACYVVDLTYIGQGVDQYVITLFAPNPIWEANSSTADTTSPVNNAGNVAVLPSLELTCSTHATRKRFTVAGAGRGGGLKQVPIRFDVDSTALTASNAYVTVNGVSVPFYVGDAGAATSFVWALVDTASDGSATTVDIVYGSGISNPLAGALDDGGMDWTETGSSNTVWKWDDLQVGNRPGRAGVWRPALITDRQSTSTTIITNTASTVEIEVASSATTYANDADAIVLETGGVGFSQLDNVSRQTSTGQRVNLKTRDAGNWLETTDWTVAAIGTVTSSVALTNGVQIMISVIFANKLTLTKASGNPWTLTLTDTPTVTLVHTQNIDIYTGDLTVGGYTISFSDFLVDDGTLTIEHGDEGWTITSSVADARFYGPDDRIQFSDGDVFLRLEPGNNTVTNGVTGASWELNYRSGYA